MNILSIYENKKCPAKVCKDLKYFDIIEEKCTGCHICFKVCPVSAISGNPKNFMLSTRNFALNAVCVLKNAPKNSMQ